MNANKVWMVSFPACVIAALSCVGGHDLLHPGLGCSYTQTVPLNQPTAAIAYVWTAEGNSEHNWAALQPTGESFLNVAYVPQGAWHVPNNTRGLAFDAFAEGSSGVIAVIYALEYTVPPLACRGSVTWNATTSVTLPHGICVTTISDLYNCLNNSAIFDDFQMLYVNDLSASMGVAGPPGDLLKSALYAALDPVFEPADLRRTGRYAGSLSLSYPFSSSFDLEKGKTAHIYLGLAVMVMNSHSVWNCLERCYTVPDETLAEHGVFKLESANGSVSITVKPNPLMVPAPSTPATQ
jgi:hypothetical protein